MASTMTLLQLRTAVRQRADMTNSQFVTDAELNSYINQSAYELYDLLVEEYGNDYYVATPYSFTTDGINETFVLPADFYKLLGVDLLVPGSGGYIPLDPFAFSERNDFNILNSPVLPVGYGSVLRYRLQSNNIWLKPKPQAGQSLQLYYVPRFTELSLDTDTLDGISGWTEYVIVDAAIKCKDKEESDVSVLAVQKAGLIKRIVDGASSRDAGKAPTVADTASKNWRYGWWS